MRGLLSRPVSWRAALFTVVIFVVVAIALGAAIPIETRVREGLAFPFVLAGMALTVWDLRRAKDPSVSSFAAAIVAVSASVILGYQGEAHALKVPLLAVLGLSTGVIVLAVLVTVVAATWLGHAGHTDDEGQQ